VTNVSITDIVTNVTIEGDEVKVTVGQGQSGVGVPAGGTTGQVLAKTSATDYATAWTNPTAPTSANYIDFDTATAYADAVARLRWDSAYSTLSLGLDADVELKLGQGLYKRARNNSGGPIAKGEVVYVSGSHGGTQLAISKASNASEVTSAETIGVAAEAIANNASGMVQTFGYLEGFATNGYAGAEGTPLYLGATAGTMQSNLPTQPAHGVRVGFLVKKAGGGAGSIFVNIQNYQEIEELSDFLKGTYADFDLISYDLAAGVWRNRTVADALPTNSVALNKLAQIPTSRLLGNASGATGSPAALAVSSPLGFNGVSGNLEFNAPGTNGQVYYRASGALATSAKFGWNDSTATLTIADLAGEQIAISPTAFAGTLYSVSGVNTGDQFTSLPADVVLGRTTGTGAAQQITCTAAGRAILDDASASAQRTTLGLGTTDSPQFAKVILENGEFIENTPDGDVQIMPAPGNSSFVGIRFQFNWSNDTVRIGTKRSLTGTNDDGRIQWLVPLQLFDNTNFIFGDYSRSAMRQSVASSRPQTMQVGVNLVGTGPTQDHSNHAFVICHYGHLGNVNRMPTTLYADPSLLVYSLDDAQPNDFARLTHDQTDGLLESGNGKLRLKGASAVRIEGPSGGFDLPATGGAIGRVLTANSSGDAVWERTSNPRAISRAFTDCFNFQDYTNTANGTAAAVGMNNNGEAGHWGVAQATTGSTATGRSALVSANLSTMWLGSGACWFEAQVRCPSTISNSTETYVLFAGLTDSVSGTPVDAVWFTYTDTAGTGATWRTECRSNSVSTGPTNVGSNLVANQWYTLGIEVNAAGTEAKFYLDGTLVDTVTTNIPTGSARALGFGVGIRKTVGATARAFSIDYVLLETELAR
jgi:hypothetical protein